MYLAAADDIHSTDAKVKVIMIDPVSKNKQKLQTFLTLGRAKHMRNAYLQTAPHLEGLFFPVPLSSSVAPFLVLCTNLYKNVLLHCHMCIKALNLLYNL